MAGGLVCNQTNTPKPEACNGFDDDCNGSTDEGNPGGGGACVSTQLGECAAGTLVCSGGGIVCSPNKTPVPESCNGKDDDCDGSIDDGNPGGGGGCSTGLLGECAAGTRACSGGALVCNQNKLAAAEICNGKDDDCDGATDDGNPGGGLACSTGQLGVCAAGTTACSSGSIACNRNVAPSAEIPNGLDDNCDGLVDEGLGFTSCLEIHDANPALTSGTYSIDPDGKGSLPALSVYCDMVSDGGGYTWQKFDDASLQHDSRVHVAFCASKGLEIIVRKSRPHATALYAWNGNQNPPLVNIVPNFVGAAGLANWHGVCRNQPCPFWMNDTGGEIGCGVGNEPSGDNNLETRPYARAAGGCGVDGNWNDAGFYVETVGTVICSTNDKEAIQPL